MPMSLIDQLRAPDHAALTGLIDLLVDDALDRPLREAVDVERWPALVGELLRAWAASEAAERRLVETVQEGIEQLADVTGPLGERLPDTVRKGLQDLARRPYSPNKELVLKLIDQEPVRKLLREILLDTVTRFAKKLRSTGEATTVGGALGGLGRFAKRRAGTLGSIAGEVASAVGGEVEKQVERKAAEFVDGALSGVIHRIASKLGDPTHAADQAALRMALLDSALRLTGPEVAEELRRSDPEGLATLLRRSLQGWIDSDGFEDQLRSGLESIVTAQGDRTLRATLDDVGLRDTLTTTARELGIEHARRFVATAAFATWLRDLEA
jgi:hypothetical protein